jgi:hypothetical protein
MGLTTLVWLSIFEQDAKAYRLLLKIGRYDIIDDGTAISDIKGQLRGSLENVQTCPVEVSMGL